jgi:hypothetical protein
MTKEQTLESACRKYRTFLIGSKIVDGDINAVYESMENWAKSEIADFDIWKHKNGWIFDGEWYDQTDKPTPLLEAKTLYQLYIQSKGQ